VSDIGLQLADVVARGYYAVFDADNVGREHFYRDAGVQPRYRHELDVRPSVKRVNCDKTKETFLYHIYDL